MKETLEKILEHKVVAILRNYSLNESVNITRAFLDGGIKLVEVTMNSDDALATIEELVTTFKDDAFIGAGTVITIEQVEAAANAGAKYIISPNVNEAVIKKTKELNLISIPGAFSPTEIIKAVDAGADIVKIFPINILGTGYLQQIKGPIDQVKFMATGGIDAKLGKELISMGCEAIGVGAQLVGKEEIMKQEWDELEKNAGKYNEFVLGKN